MNFNKFSISTFQVHTLSLRNQPSNRHNRQHQTLITHQAITHPLRHLTVTHLTEAIRPTVLTHTLVAIPHMAEIRPMVETRPMGETHLTAVTLTLVAAHPMEETHPMVVIHHMEAVLRTAAVAVTMEDHHTAEAAVTLEALRPMEEATHTVEPLVEAATRMAVALPTAARARTLEGSAAVAVLSIAF